MDGCRARRASKPAGRAFLTGGFTVGRRLHGENEAGRIGLGGQITTDDGFHTIEFFRLAGHGLGPSGGGAVRFTGNGDTRGLRRAVPTRGPVWNGKNPPEGSGLSVAETRISYSIDVVDHSLFSTSGTRGRLYSVSPRVWQSGKRPSKSKTAVDQRTQSCYHLDP